MWQRFWEGVPEDLVVEVKRQPKWRMFRGEQAFRGWSFICPGRVNAQGVHRPCGRRCMYLFWPRRVWTLPEALGGEEGFEVGDARRDARGGLAEGARGRARVDVQGDARRATVRCGDGGGGGRRLALAGQWFPGGADPIASTGPRMFACGPCWGLRSACMANDAGWNEFISQISGGLLYGRDVPRPQDIVPVKRKKREYQHVKRRKGRGKEGHEAFIPRLGDAQVR